MTLPQNVQAREVKAEALQLGLLVAAGEGYFVDQSEGVHNLRLTYSFATPDDIQAGVKLLAEIAGQMAKA
jgi:DNA-binding transcriptional MocR family regulator